MVGRLAGKVALITGGVGGLGEAQVRRFASEGALVAIADQRRQQGEALAAELAGLVSFVMLDVTDAEQWAGAVRAVIEQWGRLDILVNTAGIGIAGPMELTPFEDHLNVLNVNVNGVYLGMREVAAPMRRQGGGSIVNVSSINGLSGPRNVISYVASKFAVTGMTRSAACELGRDGIRVNSVHPGPVDTPMIDDAMRPAIERLVAPQPIPRLCRPDEVASAVLFLASDEASYITGAQLLVDGGHLAGPFREIPEAAASFS